MIVSVGKFAEDLELTLYYRGSGTVNLVNSDINRPGLQLAGFFKRFAYERVQILGNTEMLFWKEVDEEFRIDRMKTFFKYDVPCIIITRGYDPPPEMMEQAEKMQIPVFTTKGVTTKIVQEVIVYVNKLLAPSITRHGVLMDVDGVGMFIVGDSSIGKSETALELVKRGHRLVADDAVEIKKIDEKTLIGTSPELTRFLMEIRGLGIIDVQKLYGVGSVILEKSIDVVIEMEDWDESKEYDRIGIDDHYVSILGVDLPKVLMPVRPGRNLAIIMEVASRNIRLKKMGFHTALEFDQKLAQYLEE